MREDDEVDEDEDNLDEDQSRMADRRRQSNSSFWLKLRRSRSLQQREQVQATIKGGGTLANGIKGSKRFGG